MRWAYARSADLALELAPVAQGEARFFAVLEDHGPLGVAVHDRRRDAQSQPSLVDDPVRPVVLAMARRLGRRADHLSSRKTRERAKKVWKGGLVAAATGPNRPKQVPTGPNRPKQAQTGPNRPKQAPTGRSARTLRSADHAAAVVLHTSIRSCETVTSIRFGELTSRSMPAVAGMGVVCRACASSRQPPT